MDDLTRRAAVAERAARAGSDLAMAEFRTGIAVETKEGKTDVVTQADRDAQNRVIEVIREEFPDDAIVGEEEDALKEVPEAGPAWVIDPIDGTSNFVRDVPIWATSVAAVIDGEPVAATNAMPAIGDYYVADDEETRLNGDPVQVSDRTDPEACTVAPTLWWDFDQREVFARVVRAVVERFGDVRRLGCAQATLSLVADGGLDGALSDVRPNPWDTVAGVHLLRNAGGEATDVEGERWRHDSTGLVVSNGRVHGTILEAVRAATER
ncbi:inositol monophosphatase family protein [Halalkalicoccus jeotgali]|uniref:fructose-bisphosphatase n=1 Tax=Halalkalicoccus jeotgali (strain DSM 18796 / CECT 7217 / JCM 14584 / KCTC 4019 / B3) TaxID=795797 RepID=D8J8Q6_HALJB|nr:inositol monophosphatase [Halalkalicoccus jeotgali]ADJ14241.1 probable inositol-1(or 4)-monophosphatase / fructose-1,6-bisphosphatase, archaeal type [Halalkalicoccus jeotgali B3]ELY40503.1 putative inositol-1(or 4)-monophosphatase / fructose-1,6-bisphosphatase [Halalkalicoccus jeotgali B3]